MKSMHKLHKYKITLKNQKLLKFISKQHIESMFVEIVDDAAFLIFKGVNVMINTDQIKKITIDGVEYKVGHYVH